MRDDDYKREFQKRINETAEYDLKKALEHEVRILKKSEKGPLAKLRDDIEMMFYLIRDYWNGNYREISWGTIASIVAALLYVLSPLDLIPDVILGVGLVDDAAMVALCLKLVHDDLDKYRKFRTEQKKLQDKHFEGF